MINSYQEMNTALERLADALNLAHMRSFAPKDLVSYYELPEEVFNKLDNIYDRILDLDTEVLEFIEEFKTNPPKSLACSCPAENCRQHRMKEAG